ncbi:MAG: biotin transporter BioY [Candidatus Methanomethyliaceae archaeon]|nr:biotin transporter BioY [Candidatus Methanomethyliaceae archaeon]
MSTTRNRIKIIAISSLFAALTASGAWISIPFFPVPLTLQTLFVYLAVLVLGRYAALSQAIYIGMGLLGMPVFARGMSGYGVLVGPTGGFLIGFLLGSFVSGILLEMGKGKRYSNASAMITCIFFIFGLGWAWLAYWLNWNFNMALWSGVIPFLPGDVLKAGLAMIIKRKIEHVIKSATP